MTPCANKKSVTFVAVNKEYCAILLLLSFLIVLSHQVIPHHHHDIGASNIIHSRAVTDGHHHTSNDHSHEEGAKENTAKNNHEHSIPHYHHVSDTNDFNRANIEETNVHWHLIKIFVVVSLFNKQYSNALKSTKRKFGDPPFYIRSLFEPAAIALRGPPSIA